MNGGEKQIYFIDSHIIAMPIRYRAVNRGMMSNSFFGGALFLRLALGSISNILSTLVIPIY